MSTALVSFADIGYRARMGYDFSFERPGKPGEGLYRFNSAHMSIVREILREVGAAKEDGFEQALKTEGFEPTAESVSMKKFRSNGDWLVTPAECRFIAERLRKGLAAKVHSELLSFYDDAPPREEVTRMIAEFADYNERAAEHDGYRVR